MKQLNIFQVCARNLTPQTAQAVATYLPKAGSVNGKDIYLVCAPTPDASWPHDLYRLVEYLKTETMTPFYLQVDAQAPLVRALDEYVMPAVGLVNEKD